MLNPEEEDWRAWQSFLIQWGLVFTLMLIALVLLPYALREMGYEVRVRDRWNQRSPVPRHRPPARCSNRIMHGSPIGVQPPRFASQRAS